MNHNLQFTLFLVFFFIQALPTSVEAQVDSNYGEAFSDSSKLTSIIVEFPSFNDQKGTFGNYSDAKFFIDEVSKSNPREILDIKELRRNGSLLATINSNNTKPTTLATIAEGGGVIKREETYWPFLAEIPEIIGLDKFKSAPEIPSGEVSSDIAIAVLDTGFQIDHPFLKGKIIGQACFSSFDPVQKIRSNCPNGKSYDLSIDSAQACDEMMQNCDHGTHVAGIATGNQVVDPRDKNVNIQGIGNSVNIYAIQIFSSFDRKEDCKPKSPPCIKARDSSIIQAIEHVISENIRHRRGEDVPNIVALSMSLGKGEYQNNCDASNALNSSIRFLQETGVATFIASGNNGAEGVAAPSCISSAVAVSAVTKSGEIWTKSNRHNGTLVDIFAPGVSIYSSTTRSSYSVKSGTSMATPIVASAYALLKAKYPDRTVVDIIASLEQSGSTVKDSRSDTDFPVLNIENSDRLLETGLPINIAAKVVSLSRDSNEKGNQFLMLVAEDYDSTNIHDFLNSKSENLSAEVKADGIRIERVNEQFLRLSTDNPINRNLLKTRVNELIPAFDNIFIEQAYVSD